MGDATLYLDEAGLALADETVPVAEALLMTFFDTLSIARDKGIEVLRSSYVWDVQGAAGTPFSEFLFGHPELDRDLVVGLGSALNQLVEWEDALVDHLDVHDCGGKFLDVAPSLVAVAAIPGPPGSRGAISTGLHGWAGSTPVVAKPGGSPVDIYFVTRVADLALWCRSWLSTSVLEPAVISRMSANCYPAIDFAPEVWGQCRQFHGGLSGVGTALLAGLAGLNDHAPVVFAETVNNHERARRLAALAGIDCSPESPNTHRNAAAMREREVTYGGTALVCEWHLKLGPTRNRVHFLVQGDRVLVGIFADHLTV